MSDPHRTPAAPPAENVEALEAELRRLEAEREARAEARRIAKAPEELAKKIKREKDAILFEQLQEKHAPKRLGRVTTPSGDMVVVREPAPIIYQRLLDETNRSDHPNPKVRTSMALAAEKAAKECVIYPDRATYNALAEDCATLHATVCSTALELGKSVAEEDEGK